LRQPIVGTRVGDDTNALEKTTLFEHWARSSHYATYDGIVAFGEHAKILQEIAAYVLTYFVEARTDQVTGFQRGIVAYVPEYCVLDCRRQRITE
jgi:hypothetical protein